MKDLRIFTIGSCDDTTLLPHIDDYKKYLGDMYDVHREMIDSSMIFSIILQHDDFYDGVSIENVVDIAIKAGSNMIILDFNKNIGFLYKRECFIKLIMNLLMEHNKKRFSDEFIRIENPHDDHKAVFVLSKEFYKTSLEIHGDEDNKTTKKDEHPMEELGLDLSQMHEKSDHNTTEYDPDERLEHITNTSQSMSMHELLGSVEPVNGYPYIVNGPITISTGFKGVTVSIMSNEYKMFATEFIVSSKECDHYLFSITIQPICPGVSDKDIMNFMMNYEDAKAFYANIIDEIRKIYECKVSHMQYNKH